MPSSYIRGKNVNMQVVGVESLTLLKQVYGDYAKYRKMAIWMCKGHTADADDLVQKTMMSVYEGIHNFRGDCQLNTWVISIMRNHSYTRYRERSVMPVRLKRYQHYCDVLLENLAPSPEELLIADDKTQLAESIKKLIREEFTYPIRETLVYFFLLERTHKEIAELMGVPMGTAKTRVYHGVKRLRELLSTKSPS